MASSSSSLYDESGRVVELLAANNFIMALEVAKSLVSGHPDSALANALTALALMKMSFRDSCVVRRSEYIASALDFSKTALALSPKSIAFGFLNAKIHLANAHDDAAIQECESAMSIEDPQDPWLDFLGIVKEGNDPDRQKSSKESRIERVRTELRRLLVKAKSFKFKRLVEDHSLGEIYNDIQALQDRKEEIQTRFDRERQSFVKMEMPSPSTSARKLKKVSNYWNNVMSLEAKKDFLSVKIEKFRAKEMLAEAVEYAKEMKSWKFSTCCCCGQRFTDEELNMEHIKIAHLGTLSEELQSVVPTTVPISEIQIGDWRPVNVVAAAKLIEDLSRNSSGNKGQDEQDLKMKKWPHSDNFNRNKLITSIWILLQLFITIKCFAPSHLYILLDLILEMLKNRVPETLLNQRWMKTTLVSVCFLDEPELESIHKFLMEELGFSCGLKILNSFSRKEARRDLSITYESIIFRDGHLSHLIPLLDETSELASRSVDDIKNVGQEYRDNIVHWLFTSDKPIGEKLKEWEKYREASKSLGMELFKIIESEFHRLQGICENKCQYLRHEKLWLDMEGICLEEDQRRKEISGNPQSYRSLFLKRQKDIEKEKSIDGMGSMELDIIESILKKAQTDEEIKMLFQMHIDQMGGKCFKSDATILATNAAMQQTWKKLKMVTSYDYRSIVMPFLKRFMRAQLEHMVYNATAKSNAEKNTEKGGDDARHGQGKSKDKKKKKYHRKAEEFKATGGSEDQQENVEQNLVPAAHGTDHPLNSEVVGSVTTDELEQEERELTRKAEEESRIEKHQGMLARHLEYQRQIENEAKQKSLAEIDKAPTSTGNVAEDVPFNGVNFDMFDLIDFISHQIG
nr:uncharacterized protein LOC112015599 [Quercus suber]POE46027.1 hypothetical protein CFP56_36035 [Quercus suber]